MVRLVLHLLSHNLYLTPWLFFTSSSGRVHQLYITSKPLHKARYHTLHLVPPRHPSYSFWRSPCRWCAGRIGDGCHRVFNRCCKRNG
ncbi:hypothetical protein F5890DRAFT_1521095 [Lentinula detonsa]|uniref:Uncharacterized protein n=1 Tax=Lentinula detonsa TaxID=2804962 RepID=A0AA38UTL4_9AGAR|nr:hypothetical protein F5890DRAFT_1521095 [Lentinula detonsa]